jgi:hypothetical protein
MVRDLHLKNIIERDRGLSDREQQITNLVCDDLPNKVIANRLGLSEGTVKAHCTGFIQNLVLGVGANSSRCRCLAETRSEKPSPERPVLPLDGEGCISGMSSSPCVHGPSVFFLRTSCQAKKNALAPNYILHVPGTSRDYPQGRKGRTGPSFPWLSPGWRAI